MLEGDQKTAFEDEKVESDSRDSFNSSLPIVSFAADNCSPISSILSIGDLVTVLERNIPGSKHREKGLAKVSQVIPISRDQLSPNDHPFLYDVTFVIGGKLYALLRSDLEYTTQAVFTGDRRKRPSPETVDSTKENKEKVVNANSYNKRRVVKFSGSRTLKEKDVNHAGASANIVPVTDPYDRHKKELEKALLKLENADRMGFFDTNQSHVASLSSLQPSESYTHPPASWKEIRGRLHSEYYVLDRYKVISEMRERLMTPYLSWRLSNGQTATFKMPADEVRFTKGVDWELFRNDVINMCQRVTRTVSNMDGTASDDIITASSKIISVLEDIVSRSLKRHTSEMRLAECKLRYSEILRSSCNKEAAMQGIWRKTPFPERLYQRLASSNVLCDGLSQLDQRTAIYELETSLSDRFVGQTYTYDDNGQSESWMKSVVNDNTLKQGKRRNNEYDEERVAAYMQADAGLVKAQVCTSMEKLLITVQDRVMTELGVLHKPEVRSVNWLDGDTRKLKHKLSTENHTMHSDQADNEEIHILNSNNFDSMESSKSLTPEVIEQPVWGVDCYTRKNIQACLEADFDSDIALEFIEKWLLPAINACPEEFAHDISHAAKFLEDYAHMNSDSNINTTQNHSLEYGLSLASKALHDKIMNSAPPWLRSVAHQFRTAVEAIGGHEFCVHPKGHGSVVICRDGIPANTLVTHYRGEVYPPWRWGEKLDAIEEIQKKYKLKPHLPDFYNMVLERPQNDPRGYGLLFVDASRKAGLGSSFSHSCNPTCEVKVVALHGMLSLAITTLRHIEVGEELSFDYNAVTESLDEYRAAICLCGNKRCRGSFLHFATADCYQEVLRQRFPVAARFASLAKSCTKKTLSEQDEERLESHGFGTAAFGAVSYSYGSLSRGSAIKPNESLNNVPVWLLTFAAETLQYIEYERRKLPIALVLKDLAKKDGMIESIQNRPIGNMHQREKKKIPKIKSDPLLSSSARKRKTKDIDSIILRNISFEQADGEGWLSMEQRIHQLVQTLSRVGRVLDRHRESLVDVPSYEGLSLSGRDLHHPVSIVPDEEIIDYLWNSETGLYSTIRKRISNQPLLKEQLETVTSKYTIIDECQYSNPAQARKLLSAALVEIRDLILKYLEQTKKSFEKNAMKKKRKSFKKQKSLELCSENNFMNDVMIVYDTTDEQPSFTYDRKEIDIMEATCDLLMLYAGTETFFEMKPYLSFSSSPIDVYARELGNIVTESSNSATRVKMENQTVREGVTDSAHNQTTISCSNILSDRISCEKQCPFDEVVASLSVEYSGNYVVSLLLQWFSGGINLKPGLPDIHGCIMLPSLNEVFYDVKEQETSDAFEYATKVRPLLLSHLEDTQRRGEPWSDELKKFFFGNEDKQHSKYVGSPMLDSFITGDDTVMLNIIRELKVSSNVKPTHLEDTGKPPEKIGLSFEKDGAPIQATCNWVQCDSCSKWRKLPWHVQVDSLPELFTCKDNQWNPNSNYCEAPEDNWDDADAPVGSNNIPEEAFFVGARFDVQRERSKKFAEAVVVNIDYSAAEKQAQFHFLRASKEKDEWISISSTRIAQHKSYVR